MTRIRKGLDLPIAGEPVQDSIQDGKALRRVAVLGDDYIGMKPTMEVKVGDDVKIGQLLFTDKKNPLIRHTSPAAGKVVEVNRGAKRAFKSLVIELAGKEEAIEFEKFDEDKLNSLTREDVVKHLVATGMWTSLRMRPFSMVADPAGTAHAVFVTAMDTNPLAPSVQKLIDGNEKKLVNGLRVISKLTEGSVYVAKAPETKLPDSGVSNVKVEDFQGPHPAGNAGTHMHFLAPVSRKRISWYIGIQDVIAIGSLFVNGTLDVKRVVSLAGPGVTSPRLLNTRIGASLTELTAGELKDGNKRIISGSVFSGRTAADLVPYLGRYHQQVTVLEEGTEKEFLGWINPFIGKFSILNLVFSRLSFGKKFDFTTAVNGGKRAIVPIGNYERVMPLDIIPTYLLRALAVDDVDDAEKLGALELDEEDLALCTFVCQSKLEYGPMLRKNLTTIQKEG
ncbi:MAG: Na(+)-translocating NADH-quinone reductase subunit A [Calditrichia bacterium]